MNFIIKNLETLCADIFYHLLFSFSNYNACSVNYILFNFS